MNKKQEKHKFKEKNPGKKNKEKKHEKQYSRNKKPGETGFKKQEIMKNRIQRTRIQEKQDPKDQRSCRRIRKITKKKKQDSTNHGITKPAE